MSFQEFNNEFTQNSYIPYSCNDNNPEFVKYQEFNTGYKTKEYYNNGSSTLALHGNIIEEDDLSKLFFSEKNIKRIQHKIKNEIYKKTSGKFILEEDQDESDLLIAMRAVFLQDAKHLKNHLVSQVKLLNIKIINYIVPDMITNINQHYGYIKDINKPLEPIMRPLNVNNAGRTTLPPISTIYNSH